MTTLIICGGGYVSGKEIMALELARGLRRREADVRVAVTSWSNGDFPCRLRKEGIAATALPLGFISATLRKEPLLMTADQMRCLPTLFWRYSQLLGTARPSSVIHTNWHHLLLLSPFLRRDRDILWMHETIPSKLQYQITFRALIRRLKGIVCVSAAVANSAKAIGLPPEKINTIHNGITDPARKRGHVHKPSTAINIGIVGQIGVWKGHEDLVTAMQTVLTRHTSVHVHVFGTGADEYVRKLRSSTVRSGMSGAFSWHGFTTDQSEIYSGLDICVVPSRFAEPFGLAALEPAFFGIPVIATDRGGLPEVVVHEQTGLVVPGEAPEELAMAIARLVESPDLRCRLGTKARVRARKKFTVSLMIDSFVKVMTANKGAKLN